MNFKEFIGNTQKLFQEQNIDCFVLEAKLIISYFFEIKLSYIFLYNDREISDENLTKLQNIINARLTGKPLSKIFGKKTFWDYDFITNEYVLDPRPETELIIEEILKLYNTKDKLTICDFGTGSGCIIVTLLKIFENSTGVGVDISEKALNIAKQNAKLLNINERINFKISNWNDNIDEKFDIIISNPPYIPTLFIDELSNTVKQFDPMLALDGGENGLDCYKYLAQNLKKNCKNNTKIFLEIGINQEENIINIFEKNNFKLFKQTKDYSSITRILVFEL